jgi:Bacterial RNA polymerase, alpha chain C terminal domain
MTEPKDGGGAILLLALRRALAADDILQVLKSRPWIADHLAALIHKKTKCNGSTPIMESGLSRRARTAILKLLPNARTLDDIAGLTDSQLPYTGSWDNATRREIRDMLWWCFGTEFFDYHQADDCNSVDDLNFPYSVIQDLKGMGIETINDFTLRSADELLQIPLLGPAKLRKVRQKLAKRGLKLRDDP